MTKKRLDTIYNYLKENQLLVTAKTIAEDLEIPLHETQELLNKLVEDKYVIRMEDKEYPVLEDGYIINPAYADFDGYEVEFARKNFENYGLVKCLAWIGAISGIFALLLKLVELVGLLPR